LIYGMCFKECAWMTLGCVGVGFRAR